MLFLKPTGMDTPLAISRCVWLSVVRAPIAAQLTRSHVYWSAEELQVVDRYARAVVDGRYGSAVLAVRDCTAELASLHKQNQDRYREVNPRAPQHVLPRIRAALHKHRPIRQFLVWEDWEILSMVSCLAG